jgi:hypothetical protein
MVQFYSVLIQYIMVHNKIWHFTQRYVPLWYVTQKYSISENDTLKNGTALQHITVTKRYSYKIVQLQNLE